jgi:LPS-assembly protein
MRAAVISPVAITASRAYWARGARFGARAIPILLAVILLLAQALSPALAQHQPVNKATTSGASAFGTKKPLIAKPPPIDRTKPMLLNADELVYDQGNRRITARGNVEIYFNNYTILADQVIYDEGRSKLEAQGNVKIKEPDGAVISAERFEMTDDFRDGFIDALRVVTKEDARIAAGKATRIDGDTIVYDNSLFTPCKPCQNDPSKPPLWQVKAVKITHKQAEGTIYYEGAQLEFFGVPIGYVPYFWGPDPSVKRKSGLLSPEIGNTRDLGYTYEQPYYFALAPNYDLTLNPMYTSRQGVLWKGEWRHRLATGQYNIKGALIDQDASKLPSDTKDRQDLDGWRGSLETHGLFKLSSWWTFGWDVTVESDDTFRRFYKLDNVLRTDRVSDVFLIGQSEKNYLSIYGYHFGGLLASDFNTRTNPVLDSQNTTSWVHPVIDYNYVSKGPVLGGELRFDANALALSRADGPDMNRVVAMVKWRRQMITKWGQVFTPFAHIRADLYQLSATTSTNPNLEDKDFVSRGMVTAGVDYRYPLVRRTERGAHVVEPVAQIIARPDRVEQRGIPNEDAKSLVFSDALLFDIDKFSGFDRIETGIRANVGLQYSFQHNKGGFARAVIGESFHLSDDAANPFTQGTGLEKRRSDYVLGLYYEPNTNYRFLAQSRFDSASWNLQRTDIFSYLNWGPVQASLNYAFTRTNAVEFNLTAGAALPQDKQELIGSLQFRLAEHWYLIGAARYDLQNNQLLQNSIGLKYLDECFMLSATYTETHISDRDIRPDRSVMLRFELKHLGGFGYQTNNLQLPASPIAGNVHEDKKAN